MTPSNDPADRFRRLAERFTETVALTPLDAWDEPSPCEGWRALDVLHHVVTSEAAFLDRMPFATPIDLTFGDPPAIDEVIRAWDLVRSLVQSTLDDPSRAAQPYDGYFGPTTFEATVDRFYSSDLVVHAWDIAAATGRADEHRIDPDEMARYRSDFDGMSEMLRQPGILGPELEVADDADAQTRFLAYLGRRQP